MSACTTGHEIASMARTQRVRARTRATRTRASRTQQCGGGMGVGARVRWGPVGKLRRQGPVRGIETTEEGRRVGAVWDGGRQAESGIATVGAVWGWAGHDYTLLSALLLLIWPLLLLVVVY